MGVNKYYKTLWNVELKRSLDSEDSLRKFSSPEVNMFVATKASALKGLNANSCEIVTFHSKLKKTTKLLSNKKQSVTDKKNKSNINDMGEMKKLRYEIIKFGTSGFSGRQKEDANIALLVSLGAEPPKKKARNYKEIINEKKMRNDKLEDEKYKSLVPPKKVVNTASKKNGKKNLKGLLDVYGEVKSKNRKTIRKEGKR